MASRTWGTVARERSVGIVEALNLEWQGLDCDFRGDAELWAARHQVLSGCRTLADVLAAVRCDADAALRALLAEVANDNQLAGRVVLQSLLGRMVRMAARDQRAGVDDYVAALWCQIRAYPLERRPSSIAANLALDTLKAVRRERRWVVRGEVTTWPPGDAFEGLCEQAAGRTDAGSPGPADVVGGAALLAAAHELGLIDRSTRAILTGVYLEGLSGVDVAQRHGTSAGSVRTRCSKAVGRMATAVPALLEAA